MEGIRDPGSHKKQESTAGLDSDSIVGEIMTGKRLEFPTFDMNQRPVRRVKMAGNDTPYMKAST